MIAFTHALNKQYLRTPPSTMIGDQKFTLPLEVLMQDVLIGVAGATDPQDSATRRQENLGFVELMMKFPEFQNDPVKRWHLMRIAFEAFNRPDAAQIIGTEQEAKQRAQQEAQAAQQQAQQQQQIAMMHAAAGKTPPAPSKPQGPPAGGQPPQGPPRR
jgi:hypothetical protein